MQSQIVCSGCRSLLMYPSGATNVCCALCNAVTAVPPPGMEMAQLICGGCRTLLMYTCGATSVRCSCCHTVNLAPASNVAHVNCGNCRTTLMYPYGAPSVKCAVCQFITNVNVSMHWFKYLMHSMDNYHSKERTTFLVIPKIHQMLEFLQSIKYSFGANGAGRLLYFLLYGATLLLLDRWEMLGSLFPCIGQMDRPLQHQCLQVQQHYPVLRAKLL